MSVAKPGLIGCSRLAVVAAVATACLGFSGLAQARHQAPTSAGTTTTVGTTTLSHIELNGVLATEVTVAPGEVVKIKANWEDKTPCTTCDRFVPTAFAGHPAAGCIEEAGPNNLSGVGEVNLGPAPTAPGTYNVVAQYEEQFFCGPTWNAAASTGYQVIARVTVPLPAPTSKEQCKHGGWKNFGTMFKNQGQCVSFVVHAKHAERHHHLHSH